jgi:hypothetical protein
VKAPSSASRINGFELIFKLWKKIGNFGLKNAIFE